MAGKNSGIVDWSRGFRDWSIRSHSICNALQTSYPAQYTQGWCSTHAHPILINRLKPWCGAAACFQRYVQRDMLCLCAGPSPGFSSRGAKNQKGCHILKYSIGCMQQPVGQTWNGGHRFQMGEPGTTGPLLATALPVCDALIVSTISRMLHAVTAVVIIILSVRWWSWAR